MARNGTSDDAGWREPPPRKGRQETGGKRRSVGLTVTGILACLVALALVVGSLTVYVKYREVWESIKRVDVSGDLKQVKHLPPTDPHAINVLLIGSDSRAGENGVIGGRGDIAGQRSDTVMVMHISPGAHQATVLSFPRDSVVPIYSCTAEKGSPGQAEDTGEIEQINSTFANGGPGCLWKTVELTTHIHINDFIELTFVGFEKVIDDLGGVNVCLPESVDDPMSGLDLPAGRHHIYGAQALAFWRTREDLGQGSDLQRIQRDQFLMASLLQGIEKSGLLTSPSKMSSVISDVASHMTTDKGLDQSSMLHIAEGMRGLTSKSVEFIEVPVQDYPLNSNWVQWTPQAAQLFSAIAHDTKLPATAKAAAKPGASATAVATVSPAKIDVQVLNGSGIEGIATTGAADLTNRGFNVVGNGNAPNFAYTKSVVEYSSVADLAAARTVAEQLSDVELLRDSAVTPGRIDLILGSTFTTLKAAVTSSPTADLTKTYGGITGSTSICHDGNAFAP